MKVIYKFVSAVTLVLATMILSFQVSAAEIVGGGGNAAEKLILDWSTAKPGNRANPVKFSGSILSNDLAGVQSGKIDFAIVDAPLSEADLARMKLQQFPFALSGVSIVVNLQNTMAGTLRLDGPTLGKIFAGEISHWNDPAITALNPRHDLPNTPITIVHSGESSTDYTAINSYLGSVSEKWKAAGTNAGKREWPALSVYTDRIATRISTIKSTPFSIGYLPMQYMPQPAISAIHLKNRDGTILGLSDTGIIASASTANLEEGQSASLLLINKSGNTVWPISSFSFVVVSRDRARDEKIVQLLSVISYGFKFGSLKPTVHNFVALPDQLAKSVMEKIEAFTAGTNTGSATKTSPARASQDTMQEALANRKKSEDELSRQRAEANTAAQDESRKAEERNRAARQLADETARVQAIKEAKAAKQAAEEAIKAALAAKVEAETLAEKNRLIAKAEKDRAEKEKAEKERIEKEKAEKERAIQLRNQKDEDPLEAYRRSVQ